MQLGTAASHTRAGRGRGTTRRATDTVHTRDKCHVINTATREAQSLTELWSRGGIPSDDAPPYLFGGVGDTLVPLYLATVTTVT